MNKPWFGARRYGYGLSPVSWQGWAVTAAWVVLMTGAAVWLKPRGPGWTLGGEMALLVVFLVVVAFTSDGKPWRWRGREDDRTFR